MNTIAKPATKAIAAVAQPSLQAASADIWDKKYRLKDKAGNPVDQDVDATLARVAKALAKVEEPAKQAHWEREFLWALKAGAVPAGRILSNAGAQGYKPKTSTINCTVSDTIHDSMDGILKRVHEAGLTLKAGCGVGYEFSTLRPKGAYVGGAGASTSGPLSFMDIFDKTCLTVSSAGGRRGAQMATFDVGHPDVEEFIRAKREDGRLRQFNCSLLIDHAFIKAVKEDAEWPLSFPVAEAEKDEVDLDDPRQVIWRSWPLHEGYTVREDGMVACKVYKRIRAKVLWNLIMTSTYDFAEPGFLLIDEVNRQNNNWFCESIRASNPCGEQVLPPNGACLLGSINLTRFIMEPFTDNAAFNWEDYRKCVRIFTRMLDNVVEINGLPLEGQRKEIEHKRRHGMGFLGIGSAMAMLGMRYGDQASIKFTDEVSKVLAVEGWREALVLAKEKGPAPIFTEKTVLTGELLRLQPRLWKDGFKVGDKVPNRVLHAKYSRYMEKIAQVDQRLVDQLSEVGARFTHHTSIAPTGTIALSLGNNASNGIEPSFAHMYSRNIIREGKKTKEKVDVLSYELLAYRQLVDEEASPEATDPKHRLPACFTSADDIAPKAHVDIQAAAQKWIDSSISKTVNVPTGISFEEFQDVYLYAAEKGLKGCTTFRFNPEAFSGVLVREKDLANTEYVFTLEDGSQVRVKGNEEVIYDGESHVAANLFDALKDGYYGRY